MGSIIHPIISYFNYWLRKQDSHSLQSPKVFQLYNGLKSFIQENKDADQDIEKLRISFLNNHQEIEVLDLGAGSKKVPGQHRKISSITKFSTSSRKFNQLYQYFVSQTQARTIVELGTCMGLNARYLSRIATGTVYTFEGSEQLVKSAFENEKPKNITPILGSIENTLPQFLTEIEVIDFALIDANHTYKGTLNSFNLLLEKIQQDSIIIIGDIHWSNEMEKAWRLIQTNPKVKLTLDFYECGVIFFDFSSEKKHYILDY